MSKFNSLVSSLVLVSLASAAPPPYNVSDAAGLGPVFRGVGAISGGGATSRFIPEFDATTRGEILDYLFEPNFGAALHVFKVEIGGEALATEGSEPTHMRSAPGSGGDPPNFQRGYEWLMLTEATRRNPDIVLYGLPWTWPGWVGDASARAPFAVNVSLPAQYITAWVAGARDVYNLTIDLVGVWNERSASGEAIPDYLRELRRQLDAAGLQATRILCDDTAEYYCAPMINKDPSLKAVVDFVGGHHVCTPDAQATGLPCWYAEDFHAKGGEPGAGTWASQINRRYIQNGMVATLAWNAVAAFYSGLAFDSTGLMSAQYPWAGSYEVLGTIWATAHTTQFTRPGWRFARVAPVGGGAGMLSAGGSYVAYLGPPSGARSNVTLVVEKFSNIDRGAAPEDATFCFAGGFSVGAAPLAVWQSTFAVTAGETADHFRRLPDATPDARGCVSVALPVDSVTTLTTWTTAGGKGAHAPPPPPAKFPLPYSDDFSGCVPPAAGRFWADISGSFECVETSTPPALGRAARAAPSTRALRMVTPAKPVSWESDFRPHTILGDPAWADVAFSVDVAVPVGGSATAVVGVRCSLLNQTDYAALMSEISFPGLWWGVNATGGWAVWPSIASVLDHSRGSGRLATGALSPLPPAGAFWTLTLTARGGALAGAVNGAPAFAGLDVSALPYTGWVGLATGSWGDAVEFDNVAVTQAAP